jgi:hypothetical protein
VLTGLRTGPPALRRLQICLRVIGCVATILMVIVGCTTVTDGTPSADPAIAPAYRTSVSESISASSETSRIRATKRAADNACVAFIEGAKDALEKLENYIDAYNNNGNTGSAESDAKDALNHSADLIAGSINDTLSPDLRDSLSAYADAARAVANDLSPDPVASVLNSAIHQFRDAASKAKQTCLQWVK